MQRRTLVAIALGALLGAVLGIGVLALTAPRVVGGGIDAAVLDASGRARSTFVVNQASLYVLVVAAGAIGGVTLGLIGFAAGREAAPGSKRVAMGPMAVLGGTVGVVVGFATVRAAIGVGGTISGGDITLSVFRAGIVAAVSGAATGAIVGGMSERLSRPEILGLGGEAWPSSPLAFARDAMTAVGLPGLAIALGAGLVWGFSEVLLSADSTIALILFGGVAAAVLAGAAAIAALPPRTRPDRE